MPAIPDTTSPSTSPLLDDEQPARPVVLVVEDDEAIGHIMVFILEREGFQVEWKTRGLQAQSHLHSQPPPAVAVLDISLPDLNGFQLLKQIREHKRWSKTPVLMLTAMSQTRDVSLAIAEGANDYLLKPFHPQEVVTRVHRLCGG